MFFEIREKSEVLVAMVVSFPCVRLLRRRKTLGYQLAAQRQNEPLECYNMADFPKNLLYNVLGFS